MHDFLATMEGGGYSSSFAANGYGRDLQQPQQHVAPAPSTVQSRRQTPDLFTSAPLGSSANTGYTPTPYYGGYAGAQQQAQSEGGAVYSAPYGQYEGGAAPPMAGSEGGVASSYGSLAAPAVQVGAQQQSQSQSGYYDGVWRGPSVMQPSHSAPFPPPPPLHQSSPFAPYPSYAPYTPYTSSYSLPTPPAPYAAASSAVKAPPPSQIGELYQPANQAPAPLVPTVDPSHHDSNSFSFLANPSQHSYPPYSPSYPPPPRPPSNIGTQPALAFPPTTDADAVPGPSGLSQRLGETDLENGGRISTPPVLPTYNLPPTASSSSSSSSLAASSSSLLPPTISRAPTPLSLPSHESSRSSSSSRKGKERDTSSPYVNAPHPTQQQQQQQQQQQHVVIAPAPKRRREPKDAAARKYVCQECDQRFARPSALATHILTHTKEKPFICSTCQRGFAVMSNLRRHCRVRNHTLAPSQESHARNRVSTAPPTSSSRGGRSSSHPSVLADAPPGSVRGERLSIDSSSSSGSNASGAGGSLEGTPLLTTVLPPVMEVGSAGRTQEVYRLGEAVGMKREDSAASLTGTEVLS